MLHDGFAAVPTSNATHVTAVSLLACARRRLKQSILIGGILAASAFAFVWFFLPPTKPFAYTKIYFPTKPAGAVDHPDPPVNPLTQRELITSRVVLKAVINDPEVAELEATKEKVDPLGWLLRDVSVDFPMGSEICKITLTEDRAADARIIVDKIAAIYLSKLGAESVDNRNLQMTKLREMVEQTQKEFKGELDESRKVGANGFSASTPEVMAQRQQMLNNSLIQSDIELKKIRGQIEQLNFDEKRLAARLKKLPVELTPSEFEPLFAQNPNANRFKLLRDELQSEYESKLVGFGPENPSMLALKSRIDSAEARLESLRKELRTTIAASFQEKMTEDLRKTREDLSRLKVEEADKQNEAASKQTEFENLKDATSSVGRFRPGLASKGTRLEELQSKLSKLEAEITAPVAARMLEEEAVIVKPSDSARRIKMSLIAAVCAMGGVFVLLGFLEFRQHRVVNPEEVSEIGLRLVGTIPREKASAFGINQTRWEAILNESVDTTRAVFLHTARVQNLRTVMVSSAVGGEGKTSLSTRLASSLARSGKKTLLIDGDLRSPSIHEFLAGRPEVGVCDILRGQMSVNDAIIAANTENLWVLPAGKIDSAALQALSMDGFANILVEANQRDFDFILIDSSPILPVADTLLVARHVDGVLLSMMVDVSQVERVDVACRKLAALDIPLLGTVVQGIRVNPQEYGSAYSSPMIASVT